MKIVIAGGTGFLGRALARALEGDGHEIVTLSRTAPGAPTGRVVQWIPNGTVGPWGTEIENAGAVVNLAGESIAARRWTPQQRRRIFESRVLATRSLAAAIARVSTPPSVLVSGSAVGYYGPLGDEVVAEEHAPGTDFLARICADWEAEAMRASVAGTRVARIRTGLVLARDGGALPRMLLPFWLGAGGPVGSGRQYWPWIHRQDWIDLVRWVLETPGASGAFNATAPNPVTNAEFARALGRALGRPAFMPTPGLALRLLLGAMADALLLSGQRAVPARAERLGFRFNFTQIDDALGAIFGARKAR